jgi:hypothetical protein
LPPRIAGQPIKGMGPETHVQLDLDKIRQKSRLSCGTHPGIAANPSAIAQLGQSAVVAGSPIGMTNLAFLKCVEDKRAPVGGILAPQS